MKAATSMHRKLENRVSHQLIDELEPLFRRATRCRHCFNQRWALPPLVDVAQPRWVGGGYERSRRRILIVLLNPGEGKRRSEANTRFLALLRDYRDARVPIDQVFRHQAQDIPNWGGGRFVRFYVKGLRLALNDIALANIAWCPSKDNAYPKMMLEACFKCHTSSLIRILNPDVVILSGTATHRFETVVGHMLPKAQIIPTLHYAHRKGRRSEEEELARVRGLL